MKVNFNSKPGVSFSSNPAVTILAPRWSWNHSISSCFQLQSFKRVREYVNSLPYNPSHSYAIASGNEAGKFVLDTSTPPNINLATLIEPDRPPSEGIMYSLSVTTSDGVHTATTTVYITMDTFNNDAQPVFTPPTITVTVSKLPENTSVEMFPKNQKQIIITKLMTIFSLNEG